MLLCLLDKQLVSSSTRYYKNVPMFLCLPYKQTVHTSFRYYKKCSSVTLSSR